MPLGCRCMVIRKDFPDAENSGNLREELPESRTSMTGGIDTQAVNAILFYKGSSPIVIRFDNGVVFSVDIYQGNLVVPHPALLLAKIVAQIDRTV